MDLTKTVYRENIQNVYRYNIEVIYTIYQLCHSVEGYTVKQPPSGLMFLSIDTSLNLGQ